MQSQRVIDIGPFDPIEPTTDGCHAAFGTSFDQGDRIYRMIFEAAFVQNDEYRYFCEEQRIDCKEIFIVKFDHEFNVGIKDAYKRIPLEHRLSAGEMIHLSKKLAGGTQRFVKDFEPSAIVGVPNDAKLERWYGRLANRFQVEAHLIAMRKSAYHAHSVMLIHKV